ncbi:chromosome partitioning protein ParA [Mangrovibrevibacter kandeliae]|uniref:chromosome partitioning protein ParA n=1 Tax=Mangrovibrevibacter kandeliae TaxID=2968473 RepID=UPI002118BBC1|nr:MULTISPECIES: chromosome partitioning protein ParA [unclassified Aurantimonas]MCQ8780828.1 chromosome partitioning protein ParA [Aurantimonas sp. CSK15Z-1]MCW4113608.1 chromosome partitioning protein ParA [Aurantimonas sp. MSK8Z-1]
MIPVISIGTLKTSGTTTLSLTLASVAAAAEIPTVIVDAARDADLGNWSRMAGRPPRISVERVEDDTALERCVRAARRRGDFVVIDCGDTAAAITAGARLADRAIVPVRFSPLSAHAAVATDRILAADVDGGRPGRDRCFAACGMTAIPSRIARTLEAIIDQSPTRKLDIGLVQRAAYEAPFLHGGTIFTLADEIAPGLDRARAEAASFAFEVGVLGTTQTASALAEVAQAA